MDWISCKLASQIVDFRECKICLVQCALQARRLNWRCDLWVPSRTGCLAWVCLLPLLNHSFSVEQRCWTREEDFFQLWQSWIYIWNHLLGSFNRRSAKSDLVVCLCFFFLFPSWPHLPHLEYPDAWIIKARLRSVLAWMWNENARLPLNEP